MKNVLLPLMIALAAIGVAGTGFIWGLNWPQKHDNRTLHYEYDATEYTVAEDGRTIWQVTAGQDTLWLVLPQGVDMDSVDILW